MPKAITAAAPQPVLRPAAWGELIGFVRGDVFILAMFFSLLLIGGDRVAIQAGGLTMRLVFPLLMAALFFLYTRRSRDISIPARLSLLFFLLALAGAISTGNSSVVSKSLGYTVWVFFDFFVVILLCYNMARLYPPEQVLSVWFMVFRIHVFLVIGQTAWSVAHGALERASIWFYEPSYLAIFLIAYFGSALFLFLRVGRSYALDLGLSIFVLLISGSATAIFGILFAIVLNFLVARQRWKLLFWSAGLAAFLFGVLLLFFRETRFFYLIGGFLSASQGGDLFNIILGRSGDRVIRFLVGWDAFLRHPWTGVGIGGDTAYMDSAPLPENSLQYVYSWTDTSGQPFVNIFIEVLGTMGIAGFLPFCGIVIYSIRQSVRLQRHSDVAGIVAMAFLVGFFCSILAMQFEGTMLRYYLWTPLGLAFGAIARRDLLTPSVSGGPLLGNAITG